jgi:uncharacterized membrane protein YgcG
MLMKHGYKGGGLGKEGTGITQAVEAAGPRKKEGIGRGQEANAKATKAAVAYEEGMEAADRVKRRTKLKSAAEEAASGGLWRRDHEDTAAATGDSSGGGGGGGGRDSRSRKKPRYVTASEVLEAARIEEEEGGSGQQQQKASSSSSSLFIDMRGPQTRVLSDLHEALAEDENDEEEAGDGVGGKKKKGRPVGQELLHNLSLHVDLTEEKLRNFDAKQRREQDKVALLRRDADALAVRVEAGKEQLERFKEIEAILKQAEPNDNADGSGGGGDGGGFGGSGGGSASPDKLLGVFRELRSEKFESEFALFGIAQLAPTLVTPALEAKMLGWDPLKHPDVGIDLLVEWKAMLTNSSQGNMVLESRSVATFEGLVESCVMRTVRRALLSDAWNVYDDGSSDNSGSGSSSGHGSSSGGSSGSSGGSCAAYQLVAGLAPVLASSTMDDLLHTVVFPKLKRALESWDPRQGCMQQGARFDLWLLPWLSLLGTELAPLFPTVRRKLLATLGSCDCTISEALTTSQINVLAPWLEGSNNGRGGGGSGAGGGRSGAAAAAAAAVFDGKAVDSMVFHVAEKLAFQLSTKVDINPSRQDLSVLENVLRWGPVVGDQHMLALLCGEFFPRWHGVLHGWLQQIVSDQNHAAVGAEEDVVRWYSGWRSFLEGNLGKQKSQGNNGNGNDDDNGGKKGLFSSSEHFLLGHVRGELAYGLDLMLMSAETTKEGKEGKDEKEGKAKDEKNIDNGFVSSPPPPRSSYAAAFRALHLMDSVKQTHPNSSSSSSSTQNDNAPTPPPSTAAAAAPTVAPSSFKTVVEEFAELSGITFVPKHGRNHDGFPLYSFGGVACFITDVVHVEEKGRGVWVPISLEELATRAKKG